VHDLFDRYAEAWGRHDPDAIVALHTEDTSFHAHIGQEPAVGKTAVTSVCGSIRAISRSRVRAGLAEVHSRLLGGRVEDERHSCWYRPHTFEVDLVDLITVEDGLVKSKDSYIDAVSMQAQLPMVAAQ